MIAIQCSPSLIIPVLIEKHYLHRKCNVSFAFCIMRKDHVVAALTFGTPPSRHMQKSVCPSNPGIVLELNRLWIDDSMPKGTASKFLSSALKQLPPRLIASYADTSRGHLGGVYRAANFNYSGWTDEDRKTPRFDYIVEGKHSRQASRTGGKLKDMKKVRRLPKIKFWIATGSRLQKKHLAKLCGWKTRPWDGGPYLGGDIQ